MSREEKAIQALRLIYFADQQVESFEDYEDILKGIINCDRVRSLIGDVPDEYINH